MADSRTTATTESQPRAHCYRCDKPLTLCLCARIRRIENRTPLLVLQHRRESRHPLGTARIAELGLQNCQIRVVPPHARSDERTPDWVPPGTGLLYPGHSAVDLASVSAPEAPRALLLLDGTWHQARALFRDHAWLRTLPRFRLNPAQGSRYRIRREPAFDCISTIEAMVEALGLLEPELRTDGLLRAFDALIDDQIQQAARRPRLGRARARRPAHLRALPRALVEDFDNLVIVYGEAGRPDSAPDGAPELLHWTALRLRDRARFDCVLRPPSGMPSEARLHHLGLTPEELAEGVSLEELSRRWESFVQAADELVAWNPRTLTRLGACLGKPIRALGLKGVYRRLGGINGDLDRVLSLEKAPEPEPELDESLKQIRGRARLRLNNLLRVLLLLREAATAPAAE